MVDAAIGGKTGVNLPEGKNLVGAFWQPRAVLCDTDAAGDAAAARVAQRLGRDGEVPLPHRRRPARACRSTSGSRACVAIKAAVVAGDEREAAAGGRMLNYGHTLAHALEIGRPLRPAPRRGGRPSGSFTPPSWPAALGRIDAARVAEHRAVVGRLRPARRRCPAGVDRDELLDAHGARQEGGRRAHVRARRPARPRGRCEAIDRGELAAALEAMR